MFSFRLDPKKTKRKKQASTSLEFTQQVPRMGSVSSLYPGNGAYNFYRRWCEREWLDMAHLQNESQWSQTFAMEEICFAKSRNSWALWVSLVLLFKWWRRTYGKLHRNCATIGHSGPGPPTTSAMPGMLGCSLKDTQNGTNPTKQIARKTMLGTFLYAVSLFETLEKTWQEWNPVRFYLMMLRIDW